MTQVKESQMIFLGNIIRNHGLKNIVMAGHIEDERIIGRRKLNCMSSFDRPMHVS